MRAMFGTRLLSHGNTPTTSRTSRTSMVTTRHRRSRPPGLLRRLLRRGAPVARRDGPPAPPSAEVPADDTATIRSLRRSGLRRRPLQRYLRWTDRRGSYTLPSLIPLLDIRCDPPKKCSAANTHMAGAIGGADPVQGRRTVTAAPGLPSPATRSNWGPASSRRSPRCSATSPTRWLPRACACWHRSLVSLPSVRGTQHRPGNGVSRCSTAREHCRDHHPL